MTHDYVLYVTFVTTKIVLRHPNCDASKNVPTPTVLEFDVLARFRETIPMVKSVSSSKIQRINFGFLTEITIFVTEITILPFFQKLEFSGLTDKTL